MSVYGLHPSPTESPIDTAETAVNAERLAETAFRRAERRYQLHFEQQITYKNGRRRGSKPVAQPTDLSGVVDIRQPPACQDITAVCLQQQQQAGAAVTALVFRQHPGMVVFPAAAPPELQLQLMQAALEEWPEPPARTNHTKVYGMSLCNLFQAAQQGMALQSNPQQQQQPAEQQPVQQQQQQQQQQPAPQQQQQQQEPAQQLQPQQQSQQPQQQESAQQPQLQPQQQSQQPQHSQQPAQQQQEHPQQQPDSQQACRQQSACGCTSQHSNTCSQGGSSPWAADGAGPKAAVLLRKLRWVCLGPPYDWTSRVYEPHLPHRPLPPVLLELAQRYAELALQAAEEASSSWRDATVAQEAAAATAQDAAAGAAVAQDAAAAGATEAAGAAAAAGTARPSRAFVPNAALVNYYHCGDTLNGHKDDVEADLSQPIVTLSLGCDAVFLVGGTTRDQEPTALLLRSGDVVVLGQEARACYHGLPRVLTDRPLPSELQQAAAADSAGCCGQRYTNILQHMQGCRINISVRCTD